MMNDKILYELLYNFVMQEMDNHGLEAKFISDDPETLWKNFVKSKFILENFGEIRHLIVSIAKDIDRKDKLKCQFCRIEEGLYAPSPVVYHHLCKKHRQEFDENYIDKTFIQKHPAISEIQGKEGMSTFGPSRKNA